MSRGEVLTSVLLMLQLLFLFFLVSLLVFFLLLLFYEVFMPVWLFLIISLSFLVFSLSHLVFRILRAFSLSFIYDTSYMLEKCFSDFFWPACPKEDRLDPSLPSPRVDFNPRLTRSGIPAGRLLSRQNIAPFILPSFPLLSLSLGSARSLLIINRFSRGLVLCFARDYNHCFQITFNRL
jgi:hypothetical protein